MPVVDDVTRSEFEALLREAYDISPDLGREAEAVLRLGAEQPLDPDEARRLLTRVVETLRASPTVLSDPAARVALAGGIEALVDRIVEARVRVRDHAGGSLGDRLALQARDGVEPGPVYPRPTFLERQVVLNQGFVRLGDIKLWEENERLEIHLAQFRQQHGRDPQPDELLDIMLSRLQLPGVADDQRDDQFKILELARSIAANGIRRPPIIDVDGTLLDGNRRVAASWLIKDSSEFSMEEKQRTEWVFVWQLTEHATEGDRDAVVVALNFESDHKEEWPEYIKARKVSDAWQEMLAVLPRMPNQREQSRMKRELSRRFALGPEATVVTRYLKMVAWAQEFEDHHIAKRGRDPYEVQHRASRYFQYFDELAKGERPGGVAYALKEDDRFRELVFDLLFDGKFRNWRQIRDLKYVTNDEDAYEQMVKARDADDLYEGQDHLDNAVSIARVRLPETRSLGANTRIEQFVGWLEQLPVAAFRDDIRPENLRRLRRALRLVDRQAEAILDEAAT